MTMPLHLGLYGWVELTYNETYVNADISDKKWT